MTAAPEPRRWWALAVIGLGQLLVVLDATIMSIALPHAQDGLNMSDGSRQWVITAYTLAFGGLLLLSGQVADRVGYRRTFVIGLVGFVVASVLGGAAPTAGLLFAARALQGVFAALLAPSALALLSTTFRDPGERAKAYGVFGAIAGAGSVVGLIAGGLLTEYLNWRWCLYANVPPGALAVAGALIVLRDRRGHPDSRLDLPSALLVGTGLVATTAGFGEATSRGWGDAAVLGLLVAGAVLLGCFARRQTRIRTPLLPPRIVRSRVRTGSYVTIALVTMGLFALFLSVTYYLQTVLGYSPLKTGLAFLPTAAGIIVGAARISAGLSHRVPPRGLILPGMLLAAGGMLLLTGLGTEPAYLTHVLPAELMVGLGAGTTFMAAIGSSTLGVDPRETGIASATFTTAQQIGGSIGVALLNTLASRTTQRYESAHGGGAEVDPGASVERAATVHGFAVASGWVAALLAVGAVGVGFAVDAKAQPRGDAVGPGAETRPDPPKHPAGNTPPGSPVPTSTTDELRR
ncbi:MFS transporter [Streptomyces coerulescens]|uniref:MFS transporter n=1 Tax=Streptomyces coerulescens TaxID=29304 RepID=A0ABW0CT24_STRCD